MTSNASRGQAESSILQQNIKDQLQRLVQQLADLEESRDDLDDEEYEEMRSETVEQLKEVEAILEKSVKGDVSLVDDVNAMQLTIQAAISSAFKTPQVMEMFANKQPGQLRTRLAGLERDHVIGKLSRDAYRQQKVEVLGACQKLGDKLTPAESEFLAQHGTSSLTNFLQVSGDSDAREALASAKREIRNTAAS